MNTHEKKGGLLTIITARLVTHRKTHRRHRDTVQRGAAPGQSVGAAEVISDAREHGGADGLQTCERSPRGPQPQR